ncbi:MAG: hypothetical protein H6821_12645 [Planctomycetaceae bacterium]|nr:hypothetical protein [Planctomycetales bacterium]MCB9875018.1 hypothetical protein [Planctomycetaceae bacterium]MCB9940117.1 hypothetical protein [Planctomycetaceae bacterium]HRX78019.1 hypothetical protein [Pirellulaceae bacterium]
MSRPCFALSVMLCCMAGPLLIIGKAHARDTVVSPSHDPGECIVCPLAHGPLDVCGGYSDYDYNQYWNAPPAVDEPKDSPPPTPELAGPELNAPETLTDIAADEAWDAGYEDYYADYVFGDDSVTTEAKELSVDEVEVSDLDQASESAAAPEESADHATFELYDEFGWYSDAVGKPEDYFRSFENYEPIEADDPETAATVEATADYEAYEEEWFSYEEEAVVDTDDMAVTEADEAYESLSDSANEPAIDEISNNATSDATWGDEEEWYRDEYGYAVSLDGEIAADSTEIESVPLVETGYDAAYDEAMDLEPVELVNDVAPAIDYYESFYDAYDDLYNFETAVSETTEAGTHEVATEDAADQVSKSTAVSNPEWLDKLVSRLLEPVWTVTGSVAASTAALTPSAPVANYTDECSQEWDCEADYWARPQVEKPSVVLGAADTLDGVAALLQHAAEALRSLAGQSVADTALTPPANSTR